MDEDLDPEEERIIDWCVSLKQSIARAMQAGGRATLIRKPEMIDVSTFGDATSHFIPGRGICDVITYPHVDKVPGEILEDAEADALIHGVLDGMLRVYRATGKKLEEQVRTKVHYRPYSNGVVEVVLSIF